MTTFLQTVQNYDNTVAASIEANLLCRREMLNITTLTAMLQGIHLAGKQRFVIHGTASGRIPATKPNKSTKPRANSYHGGEHNGFSI